MIVSEEIKPMTRQQLFTFLYETAFPRVALTISKSGGNFDDAKDMFQDALVIFYEKKMQQFFSVNDEPSYVTGIAKYLWYRKIKQNNSVSFIDDLDYNIPDEANDVKVSDRLLRFVEVSGKKCLELLKAFYYDKLSMKEIANKFQFSGERSATVQKYKCLEKVRDGIKQKSLSKEDFYE